jgi:hypothetical protein
MHPAFKLERSVTQVLQIAPAILWPEKARLPVIPSLHQMLRHSR